METFTGELVPGQELVSTDGRRWIVDEKSELVPVEG
jgi:hypothetical protein